MLRPRQQEKLARGTKDEEYAMSAPVHCVAAEGVGQVSSRVGVLLADADNPGMQACLERLRQGLELLNPTP